MENADKKSKIANRIFYIILTLLILISVGVTFNKIVIQKDYQIVAETSCDPAIEKCFVYTCDPADDSTCPVEESERTSYYKMVSKKAANIALCETTVDKVGCDTELNCTPDEEFCSYTFCDPDNLADGETCAEVPSNGN
jgi:hypothetical protein